MRQTSLSSEWLLTPQRYADMLLSSCGVTATCVVQDQRTETQLWPQSGALWLTGHADQPQGAAVAPLATCAQGAWLALSALAGKTTALSAQFAAYELLGERAAIAQLTRQGRVSAGGACHLLNCADGTLALNLARSDDWELLPAWLETDTLNIERRVIDGGPDSARLFTDLAALLKQKPLSLLLERARVLGLAVAAMVPPEPCTQWYKATRYAAVNQAKSHLKTPLVVDLSALWAGPLCAQLLAACGARVIKVESELRPDGARSGPKAFFDLMNADKESLSLPLHLPEGKAQLKQLLLQADIVIEASRPRALEQMGIWASEILAQSPGQVWLSLSGYGRSEPARDWIAYGDDAGVAAGLSWLAGGYRGDPVFYGDAIADPLTGLHGAVLALASWQQGGGELMELALTQVLSYCIAAGRVDPIGSKVSGSKISRSQMSDTQMLGSKPVSVSLPKARPVLKSARPLGADNERLMAEFLMARSNE